MEEQVYLNNGELRENDQLELYYFDVDECVVCILVLQKLIK